MVALTTGKKKGAGKYKKFYDKINEDFLREFPEYQGLSQGEITKGKKEKGYFKADIEHRQKMKALKQELEGYKMELRTLEIKPQDSQMKIHQLPTDRVHRGSKYSRTQRMNKGQHI
jgi:hypothetical protein